MTGFAANLPIRGRVDRDGRLIEADPPLAILHAQAGGEAGGLIAVPQIAGLVRLVRRLGIVVSRGVIAADGNRDLDLWIRVQPDGDGMALAIVAWSERAAAVPFPATAAERERDFLAAASDWGWETDGALRVTAISARLAFDLGVDVAGVRGEPLSRLFSLVPDGDGVIALLDAMATQVPFAGQPARLRASDPRPILLAGTPLIDPQGRFAGFRGNAVADSPAPSSWSAEEIQGGDAFRERLETALRGPVGRIVASADSIRAQTDGPLRRDYAEYAADIASAGRHLLALIDDLADLQAIERGDFRVEPDDIDLCDIARRASGLLSVRAADRGVRIDRPGPDDRLPAKGDFRRVLQILVNLIGNAVRYSPEGAAVWVRCEGEGTLAAVIVADQGKGIAEEDHARIFEKFERVDQSEPGGTGLGLYIARRLARAMGGDITLESAPGQGARFVLTLPAG